MYFICIWNRKYLMLDIECVRNRSLKARATLSNKYLIEYKYAEVLIT